MSTAPLQRDVAEALVEAISHRSSTNNCAPIEEQLRSSEQTREPTKLEHLPLLHLPIASLGSPLVTCLSRNIGPKASSITGFAGQ
jgi:hypothetical protein